MRFISDVVKRQMNLDDICSTVDTVTDLALYDKRGVLHEKIHFSPRRPLLLAGRKSDVSRKSGNAFPAARIGDREQNLKCDPPATCGGRPAF
jgi:hypothetical protein